MTDQAAIQAISTNALKCDAGIPTWVTQLTKNATILDVPYVLSYSDLKQGFQNPLLKALNGEIASKNVVGLAVWPVGPMVFGSKKPLNAPGDFKGLKVRVSGSEATVKALEALGASPVTLSANDVSTAVSTGAVSAVEGAEQYWASQFPKQLPYAMVAPMFNTFFGVWISKSWYEGLNAATRAVLTSTLQTVTTESFSTISNLTNEAAGRAKAEGATVHVPSATQNAAFKRALTGIRGQELAGYPKDLTSEVAAP